MRPFALALPLACTTLVTGCFGAHGSDDAAVDGSSDSGVGIDGAARDAEVCDRLAGYRTCGILCDEPCVIEDSREHFCATEHAVCRPFFRSPRCVFGRTAPGHLEFTQSDFCPPDQVCAVTPEAPPTEELTVGLCVDPAYCPEARAAGLDVTCIYSDLSEAGTIAPPGLCPESPHAFGFCGGGCGDCLSLGPGATCVGSNERRWFGMCAFNGNQPCFRGDSTPIGERACQTILGEDCACLLLRNPAGDFPEVGFTVVESACLAYRRTFSDDNVDCFDIDTWTRLPE